MARSTNLIDFGVESGEVSSQLLPSPNLVGWIDKDDILSIDLGEQIKTTGLQLLIGG